MGNRKKKEKKTGWKVIFKILCNSEGKMPQIIAWANAQHVFRTKVFAKCALFVVVLVTSKISANPAPDQGKNICKQQALYKYI